MEVVIHYSKTRHTNKTGYLQGSPNIMLLNDFNYFCSGYSLNEKTFKFHESTEKIRCVY